MSSISKPTTPAEFVEAVRSAPRVLAVGGGTKPRLFAVPGVTLISTTGLSGILDYDPTEFTFTALAGTPLREIAATLAAQGQYLPFDPPLVEAGATLGGTVAAGLSGPGRFRFGGLRDFILGVRFVDGEGRLLRMGGKVVKNAAGFDLPKFFVGSLGRFGALVEITFKVFPKPVAMLTLELPAPDSAALVRVLTEAAAKRWELDALDAAPARGAVYARLGGPAVAIEALAAEILLSYRGRRVPEPEADELWRSAREFSWAPADAVLMKIPITPTQLPSLMRELGELPGAKMWIGAGGNVAYLSMDLGHAGAADTTLRTLGLAGLSLRGDAPLWPGMHARSALQQAVKTALDPLHRFPSLED